MPKFIFCLLIVLFSCSTNQDSDQKEDKQNHINLPKYTLEVNEYENGWGYSISQNSKPIIIQKHIPSMPGVSGFDNKEKAKKCGEYIIFKLEKGLFPPTITIRELDSLEVI